MFNALYLVYLKSKMSGTDLIITNFIRNIHMYPDVQVKVDVTSKFISITLYNIFLFKKMAYVQVFSSMQLAC